MNSSALCQRLGLQVPVFLAPMAGAADIQLAIEVAKAGGLGSLACAMLKPDQIREQVAYFRKEAPGCALNLNFFCHTPPVPDAEREARWRRQLEPYYEEFSIDTSTPVTGPSRAPFDEAACALVEELRPEVVSFHFGLPDVALLARVKATGALVISSATTPDEARWLEQHGSDAIIAQGLEAGGHRGNFLDPGLTGQSGTLALVPQMVDAVNVPVIAAGGIADGRGLAAALSLGATAVQLGTAYLWCPESKISATHRQELKTGQRATAVTNVFTGRPARGLITRLMRELGPIAPDVPEFPTAAAALVGLKAMARPEAALDFTPLWAGEAYQLGREIPARELTASIAAEAAALLKRLP